MILGWWTSRRVLLIHGERLLLINQLLDLCISYTGFCPALRGAGVGNTRIRDHRIDIHQSYSPTLCTVVAIFAFAQCQLLRKLCRSNMDQWIFWRKPRSAQKQTEIRRAIGCLSSSMGLAGAVAPVTKEGRKVDWAARNHAIAEIALRRLLRHKSHCFRLNILSLGNSIVTVSGTAPNSRLLVEQQWLTYYFELTRKKITVDAEESLFEISVDFKLNTRFLLTPWIIRGDFFEIMPLKACWVFVPFALETLPDPSSFLTPWRFRSSALKPFTVFLQSIFPSISNFLCFNW
jgi:hypothetical protein